MNPRSDVEAKVAFKRELESRGFTNVRLRSAPADISGDLAGETHLFEIKLTASTGNYFGAATITEWEAALRDPDRFRFVIARKKLEIWHFREYSPEEFIQFSDIPPFKVYFRIPSDGALPQPKKRQRAVAATLKNLQQMIQFRQELKSAHETSE